LGHRAMKHILVIADPGKGEQPAFSKAMEFAQKTRGSVHVVIICYESLHHVLLLGASDSENNNLKSRILQHKEKW